MRSANSSFREEEIIPAMFLTGRCARVVADTENFISGNVASKMPRYGCFRRRLARTAQIIVLASVKSYSDILGLFTDTLLILPSCRRRFARSTHHWLSNQSYWISAVHFLQEEIQLAADCFGQFHGLMEEFNMATEAHTLLRKYRACRRV